MKVFAQFPDGRVEDVTHFADSQKLIRFASAWRNLGVTDAKIEGVMYLEIESGKWAAWAEDVRLIGDEIRLDVPDFEKMERQESCGDAMAYAAKAEVFGLSDTEIAQDLFEAGLCNVDDAERISAL